MATFMIFETFKIKIGGQVKKSKIGKQVGLGRQVNKFKDIF